MTLYARTPPNLLPAGEGGGQAMLAGWFTGQDIVPDNGDGTLSLPRDSAITTAQIGGNVAVSRISAVAGHPYTAAVTADGFIAVALWWILPDGLLIRGADAVGGGRLAVTDVAAPHTVGVLMQVLTPTARITDIPADQATVYDITVGKFSFAADPAAGAGPVLLSGAVLTPGIADPGPTPPTVVDTSLGGRLYQRLPAFYRDDDVATAYTLRRFCSGLTAGGQDNQQIVDAITAGQLTDPATARDEWIPWLAQAAGVPPAATVHDTRALLVAHALAPLVGSRAALAAVARRYLTGTKIADVFPSLVNPWQINVRVRADELVPPDDTAALAAAIMATGQVPAGCFIQVVTGLPTWDQFEAQVGTFDQAEGRRWAGVDAIDAAGL